MARESKIEKMRQAQQRQAQAEATAERRQAKPQPPKPAALPPKKKQSVVYDCGHVGVVGQLGRCRKCALAADSKFRIKRRERMNAKAMGAADNRLPHGAAFSVTYDAQEVRWSGTLAVPGATPIFAEASAVFTLLGKLDKMFRETLTQPEKTA